MKPIITAQSDDESRIKSIQRGYWIGYNEAQKIIEKLDYLKNYESVDRMPNLLLVGETNSGKTALLKKYLSFHPYYVDEHADGLNVPVLYIIAPPSPDEKRFYNTILEQLCVPTAPQYNIARREQQVIRLLKDIGTRLLIIDEIQHLSTGGSYSKQRQFLNVIKRLGNELKISLVGAGTLEAFNAMQVDDQLNNRFTKIRMKKWEFNKDYFRLLASFEQLLPLRKPSKFTQPKIASKIYSMSEGSLGETSSILRESAIAAIKLGEEQISPDLLKNLEWISPSERKQRMVG